MHPVIRTLICNPVKCVSRLEDAEGFILDRCFESRHGAGGHKSACQGGSIMCIQRLERSRSFVAMAVCLDQSSRILNVEE